MFSINSNNLKIEIENLYQLFIQNNLSFNLDLPNQNPQNFDIYIKFNSDSATFHFQSKKSQTFFKNNQHKLI